MLGKKGGLTFILPKGMSSLKYQEVGEYVFMFYLVGVMLKIAFSLKIPQPCRYLSTLRQENQAK